MEGKQSFNYVTRGGKIEFINHFRLCGVGIQLLIYCQIVTGSVVSALGAGRGRQAGDIPVVLQEQAWWWGRARGRGRSLPWMGAHASRSPTAGRTGAQLS